MWNDLTQSVQTSNMCLQSYSKPCFVLASVRYVRGTTWRIQGEGGGTRANAPPAGIWGHWWPQIIKNGGAIPIYPVPMRQEVRCRLEKSRVGKIYECCSRRHQLSACYERDVVSFDWMRYRPSGDLLRSMCSELPPLLNGSKIVSIVTLNWYLARWTEGEPSWVELKPLVLEWSWGITAILLTAAYMFSTLGWDNWISWTPNCVTYRPGRSEYLTSEQWTYYWPLSFAHMTCNIARVVNEHSFWSR